MYLLTYFSASVQTSKALLNNELTLLIAIWTGLNLYFYFLVI